MKKTLNTQSGFSLVEILLVIGIIGALMIGAFLIYPKVRTSRQVAEIVERTTMIAANAQQFFDDRSYTGLTTATALSAGILEQQQTITPWGTFVITATSTGNGFSIDLTSLPSDVCKKLVPALEPTSDVVRIGNTFVKDDTTTFNIVAAPTICTEGVTLSVWPKND